MIVTGLDDLAFTVEPIESSDVLVKNGLAVMIALVVAEDLDILRELDATILGDILVFRLALATVDIVAGSTFRTLLSKFVSDEK